ncbi:MAG: hypothetical protein ACRC14_02610 [Paracoccaceae bacterium]
MTPITRPGHANPPDTDGDLLAAMGTDAAKWAAEFCKRWPSALCQIPGKEGVCDGGDFEGTMIGWFANAIEAARPEAPLEPVRAMIDWEQRRWDAAMAAMQALCANPGGPVQANQYTGWNFVNCQSDGVAKVALSLADDLIAASKDSANE